MRIRKGSASSRLPPTMEQKRAAETLAISTALLRALIEAGLVWTIQIGDEQLIPSSEVRRLAEIQREVARRR